MSEKLGLNSEDTTCTAAVIIPLLNIKPILRERKPVKVLVSTALAKYRGVWAEICSELVLAGCLGLRGIGRGRRKLCPDIVEHPKYVRGIMNIILGYRVESGV